MRVKKYFADDLAKVIRKQKIAVMEDMKTALGAKGDATVFRLLAELNYKTSYSHRGCYYTLNEVADFDEDGIWSHKSVWFSIYGSLLATAEAIVANGEFGYYVDELDKRLHVGTKDALRMLVRDSRLYRERMEGRYLYCSSDPIMRRQQIITRRTYAEHNIGSPLSESDMVQDELKAAIILFFSLLDEKQRRLYAGLESLKLGHGGDRRMAILLGMDVGTVARGRRDLIEHDVEIDRIRKSGAGRKPVEKKHQR